MISPNFYIKQNLVRQYLGAGVYHFPIKDPSITIEWYNYTLKGTDTIYTIAERLFGKNLEYLWTYIADNNPPRHPDDWHMGDIMRLPKIIIRDSDTIKTTYKDATTTTTAI